jgi:type I restriction enzyme S subunit
VTPILEWSRHLPTGWQVVPLRAIASYIVSNVDKVPVDGEQPVRLCNYSDVYNNEFITQQLDYMPCTATKEEICKFHLEVGDVIITKDSESWDDIGIPALVTDTADGLVCGYHLALLRPHPERVMGRFLLRCLQAKVLRLQLELAANGVTRFGLPKADIGAMRIPVPPLDVQREIVSVLDREVSGINALVAAKQRVLDLLAEKRKAIIASAVTRGIDPGIKMRDSNVPWLGEIPAHWELRRMKYLFRLVAERAPEDNDYELLSLYTDIGVKPRRELVARGNKATTTDEYWIVECGDLIVNKLLAWMGAFGVSEYNGVTSPAYDILRPQIGVESFFYHHLFRCGVAATEVRARSYGIMDMRLRLYFDRLGDMPVPFPPLDEQRSIVDHITRETAKLDSVRAATERTIALLKERRAALIAEAVSGKMDLFLNAQNDAR